MFLKILQNLQENTGAFQWILRNFKNTVFYRTPLVAASALFLVAVALFIPASPLYFSALKISANTNFNLARIKKIFCILLFTIFTIIKALNEEVRQRWRQKKEVTVIQSLINFNDDFNLFQCHCIITYLYSSLGSFVWY